MRLVLHRTGFAVIALCALVAFPKAAEEANPAALFAQDPTYYSLSLSPTGKYIAALSSTDAGDRIVVMPLRPGARPNVTSLDPFDITALHWHGDDRLVVRVYDEERGRTILTPHLWRAIAIDPDGRNPVRLMRGGDVERNSNRTDQILDLSPDEPSYVHMTANTVDRFYNILPKLYRVNTDTGGRQELSTGLLDTARWIMDGNGNVVARIDIPNTRGDLIHVPDGDGFRLLATLNSDVDNTGQIMGLTEDGRSLAVAMRRENGRQGLYPLDLATGALGEALFIHPNFDIGAVLTDERSFRVIGVTYFDGDTHCRYFSPEMQSIQRRVEQVLAGQLVCIESATKDRSRVIISAGATQRPGSFHLVDLTTNRVDPVGQGYTHLDRVTLGKAQLFPYQVNTGTQVTGVLILPPSREPRGLPLVVLAGGFGGSFDWVAHYLAHRGYAVLKPGARELKGLGGVRDG